MNWWIVFLIIAILVAADKILTYVNLKLIQKNSPELNALDAEKNPAARFMFEKLGLELGSVIFFFITCASLFCVLFALANALKFVTFTSGNPYGYALWIITIIYGAVIANNFYFIFRYAKLI